MGRTTEVTAPDNLELEVTLSSIHLEKFEMHRNLEENKNFFLLLSQKEC